MTATRRDFLKTSGALVVGLTVAGEIVLDAQGTATGPYPDLDYKQLDSWIVIRPDNTATFFVGKTDLGQGTGTAFRQIMADELDMPYDKTSCVMGVTDVTVDQGGSGGSDALQTDGYPMRRVAAEARRVLLEMAAARLGVPVAQLTVSDGVVAGTRTDASGGALALQLAEAGFEVDRRAVTADGAENVRDALVALRRRTMHG